MWEVRDVTGWEVRAVEQRGRRAKRWLCAPDEATWAPPGSTWLFKEPRPGRDAEPAIEVFALDLARSVGVPSVRAHLAHRSTAEGPRRGVLILSMLGSSAGHHASLVDGPSLLAGTGFEEERSSATHTLGALRQALHKLTTPDVALHDAARVLCFDAWLGNGDRHAGNWAAIQTPDGERHFSPMFDPAACLGAELMEGTHVLAPGVDEPRVRRYALACNSGFGDGRRRIKMVEVATELNASWPEWRVGIDGWLASFSDALRDVVPALLDSCPEDWWSLQRRELAHILLKIRLTWLTELVAGAPGSIEPKLGADRG